MALDDLIKRLEAATGEDPALDLAIWEAVGRPGEYLVRDLRLSVPDYCASIDAALTLAGPDGKSELVIRDDHPFAILNSAIMDCPLGDFAALPRFICIAALRARLPLETDGT